MQRTSHASGVLLLAAGHAPSGVSRYVEADEGKLGRRTDASGVASLFGLHAVANDRTSDELRSGGADLVRWSESPGKIRRDSVLRADPEAATEYARERSTRSSGGLRDAGTIHSERHPDEECPFQCCRYERTTEIEDHYPEVRG